MTHTNREGTMQQPPISLEVLKRLGQHAQPFESIDTLLTRLIDHWDKSHPTKVYTIKVPAEQPKTHVTLARGTALPIGLKLFADYQGHKFTAKVNEHGIEWNGKTYDGPSPAAVDAKLSVGASKTAASTNGWTFWMIDAPGAPGKICQLDHYRKA